MGDTYPIQNPTKSTHFITSIAFGPVPIDVHSLSLSCTVTDAMALLARGEKGGGEFSSGKYQKNSEPKGAVRTKVETQKVKGNK